LPRPYKALRVQVPKSEAVEVVWAGAVLAVDTLVPAEHRQVTPELGVRARR
jgi:hypothetical protein